MLYRDLVQFEPIESVIQLRAADDKREATHLVQTYVVSNRMADQLVNVVFPQLQIDRPVNNKGVLVVGNYGTGKSHLMSVLSALAEHEDLAHLVRNSQVRDAAIAVAGKFKVVRSEIGGVERSLRDIVLGELERFFEKVGTPYRFPSADQITNNKGDLIKAMAGFTAKYPDKGVLFVLDELLDYLRTREERALILDLGVLRELGEVTAVAPLRFVAGIQETLFDNPRFAFVAEQLRRVRDRFEQVRIAREDIAYVVSERLLGKNDSQLAQITEHLRTFTKLYPPMAERLPEFARLFPIHPAYIDTFERVYVAEKREVLQTFSKAIRSVLDREVPTKETGLISYDHYWGVLTENPSLRTLPGVAEVVEKSSVLEGRITNAYTRKPLLPMARRIIHALSVHRLTTSDINAPLGVTVEELRDQLCLWAAMPEADAEFLSGTVQVALKEIMRTVSGQYISYNADNGQYYLNLKKDIDFDAKIAERGNFMEERDLNRYFYSALRELLNIRTSVHVTGFLIWRDELVWAEKNVMRPGYLFFGHPNERSTAQPPLDWYIYFLPPFDGQKVKPNNASDEITFHIHGLGPDFEEMVRRYAGAQAMAGESPNHRQTYQDKADQNLRSLIGWLRQNFNTHLRVSHEGATKSVPEALAQMRSSASRDAEDLLRVIASHLLAPHFRDTYPDYPAFSRLSQPISEQGRTTSAQEAVRFLAGRPRNNLAIAVLDGLKLLDPEERIKPLTSPYARYFLDMLLAKGDTQVVNQGEVIEQVAAGLQPLFKDIHFKLEPEWVVVVLLALVYTGDITLNLGGNETLDAGNMERAALKSMDELTDFRFYRRPKQVPLTVWTQVFDAFGLQSGLVRDEATREEGVRRLQEHVQDELRRVVEWQSKVQGGITLWNQPLFTDRLDFTYSVDKDGSVVSRVGERGAPGHHDFRLSQTDVLPYLRKTKDFLEGLSRYNTPGKLRNLSMTTSEAEEELSYRVRALRIKDLLDAVNGLQPLTAYLSEAGAVLPMGHEWVMRADAARQELLSQVRNMAKGGGTIDLTSWRNRLEELRRQYIQIYSDLHARHVLGPKDDERKARLLRDPRVEQLKGLSAVDILNAQELRRWGEAVIALPTCREFHTGLLEASPTCPRCHFRPAQTGMLGTASTRLDVLEDQLGEMLAGWHAALRQNLLSETAQQSISSMTATERAVIDKYLSEPEPTKASLPDGLVEAVNQALRGLRTVTMQASDLLAALQKGGMPCTIEQLAERFRGYMKETMSGHDPRNTRLTIEQE
jgi:hypothetical protein